MQRSFDARTEMASLKLEFRSRGAVTPDGVSITAYNRRGDVICSAGLSVGGQAAEEYLTLLACEVATAWLYGTASDAVRGPAENFKARRRALTKRTGV